MIDADRDDRASGLRCDLEGTIMERKQLQLGAASAACALREDHDRNSVFDIINRREDRLQAGLDIGAVEKKTVEKFHPAG